MTDLVVSEVFGPTLQGEGPTAGTPTMFLRLGRCNLSCSWCDTPYTWDWRGKNGTKYDPAALYRLSIDDAAKLVDDECKRVVITGGEPLIQSSALVEFGDLMIERRVAVEVETNGTLQPPADLVWCQWNVSPKLSNSGDAADARICPAVLGTFAEWSSKAPNVCFKFVVADEVDVLEVDELVARFDLRNVWVMPEGRDATTIIDRLKWLVPIAVERGYRVTPRLHVLAYGDRRGV